MKPCSTLVPPETSLRLIVPLPVPIPGSKYLDLVFNVTRGRDVRLELPPPSEGQYFEFPKPKGRVPPISFEYVTPNIIRIPADRVPFLGPPGKPRAIIASAGEYPEVVKFVYRDEHGRAIALYTLPEDECPQEATSFRRVEPVDPQSEMAANFGPAEYIDSLNALLLSAPDLPLTSHRRFFFLLDQHTNPALLPVLADRLIISQDEKDFRISRISLLLELLTDRVVTRAGSPSLEAPPSPQADLKGPIQYISTLLLSFIDRAFVHNGCFEQERFEEAFEMFANGDLRLQLPNLAWTTQPSSGYYFFFGEFALMAIDYDVDAWRWGELANVLIRSQRIFCRRYGPADISAATFASYRSCQYDPLKGYTPSERVSLAEEFEGSGFDELRSAATHHARTFLSGLANAI